MKKEGRQLSPEANVFAAVLGVLSIVIPISSFPFGIFFASFTGIVLGIVAIVIGVKANKAQSNSWAKAGISMGIIGIIISVIFLIWAMAFLAALAAQVNELQAQGFFDTVQTQGVAQ